MKRFLLLSMLVFSLVFAASTVSAETCPMGGGFAVKVDYFHFFDSAIKSSNAQDSVYVGGEYYHQFFFPNFLLGIEAGWAGPSGTFTDNSLGFPISQDTDITYVPIELNMKYVMPLSPCFNFALGGGVSANYMNVDVTLTTPLLPGVSVNGSDSQWLFGGQFFGELNYKYQCWEFGIDAKYQLTNEKNFNFGAGGVTATQSLSGDNLRAGGHIRFLF